MRGRRTTTAAPGQTNSAYFGRSEPATDIELDFRHGSWWKLRRQVRDALTRAGTTAATLERFDCCGSHAWIWRNTATGQRKVRASYCHNRFCLPCGRALGLRVADNLVAKLGTARGLHIILTLKHRPEDLCKTVARLRAALTRLRSTPLWKKAITGGAWFPQAHPSETDGLWHVHAHVMAEGRFIDVKALSALWLKITGDSDNVRAYPVNGCGRLAREVSRYVARPFARSLANHPDLLAELMIAFRGARLCATFGTWRGHKLTARPPAADDGLWEPVARLTDIVHRARAGDLDALIVMREILTKSHPSVGPPPLLAAAVANA